MFTRKILKFSSVIHCLSLVMDSPMLVHLHLPPDNTEATSKNNIILLCLSPQILHKHCFEFLLELTMVPRENKNNAYAKFGQINKEYYKVFSEMAHREFSRDFTVAM